MLKMSNQHIRIYAKTKGVPLWRIANEFGLSEPSMTRKLRMELSNEEQKRFIEVIDKLAEETA